MLARNVASELARNVASDDGQFVRGKTAWADRFLTRRGRLSLVMLAVVSAGVIWSLLASFFVWRWEEARARDDIAAVALSHFLALQNGLDEYLNKLVALRAFFESADVVTRAEFDVFAGRLLEREAAVQNFSWVPRVSHEDRAAFEAAAIGDGIPGYAIKAVTSDDRIVTSPEMPEYLPIYYSTVKDRRSPIYGIDLLSQPVIQHRLERARDNNQLSVVPDFILHSVEGNVHGFLFSLPVYQQGMPTNTVEERRRYLHGFAHGAFFTSEAIERILATRTTAVGLDIYLFGIDGSADALPLHVHSSRLRASPAAAKSQAQIGDGLHFAGTIKAGDAHWKLIAVPVPGGPLRAKHDRALLVLASSLLITFVAASYMHSVARHTSELLSANQEISNLAQRDSLTGLPNRRAFIGRLAEAFAASRRAGRPFAVLYFDLDHFKDTNDTLGHPAGDLLLRQVASRVQNIVRREDVFARFGGDEFALLQMDADPAAAAALASNLVKNLADPYSISNNVVRISASIGIALYTPEVASPDRLMMQADLALYRAKEDGRNGFRFHSAELDRQVHERVVVAEELRKAVAGNQLRLHYQPQVELASGRIIGIEALLRWQHPERGLLEPEHFIAISERTGVITALGEWALDEACRQVRAWRDLGLSPPVVAVNVSASQFKLSASLEEFLSATLSKWRVPPAAIEIELTESVLMEVTSQNNESLQRLQRRGIQITIDDFGMGYSSLNYLATFPVSRLKIAQELVSGVSSDPRHASVVRAAIRLANELRIACLAEGVESVEQVNFLRAAGCAFGQGNYFGRPLSGERMTAMLAERAARPGRATLQLERTAG